MTTDLRIKSFGDIDPLAVPLPNGTQVSTRIDRIIDERRIPRGAVGKVIAVHGDENEVDIVGVGRVGYRRLQPSA